MRESGLAHSWVWTVGAATVVAGVVFGQQIVVPLPAPEAPSIGRSVPAREAAETPAAPGSTPGGTSRAVAAADVDAPGASGRDAAALSSAAAPATDPAAVPKAPDRRDPLLLREATTIPSAIPERVAELEEQLGGEARVCDVLWAAYGLAFSGRSDGAGSGGCRAGSFPWEIAPGAVR